MAILSKKVMNFAYGMGAAVVIIGALFKITHKEFGPITGNLMLTLGLVVEALIFALSAFEPVEEDAKHWDWSLVYPELTGGERKAVAKQQDDVDGSLSKKLDQLLKDAKIDAELMSSLGQSIRNFEGAAKNIAPTMDSIAATKKYNEELSLAAEQLQSLNNLYKLQVENASKDAQSNKEIAENAALLKEQMKAMSSNIASLNNIYGGMLSAMTNKG